MRERVRGTVALPPLATGPVEVAVTEVAIVGEDVRIVGVPVPVAQ